MAGGLINVYGSMAMHGSLSVRDDGTSFPEAPRVGQFALNRGVLFVYALLDGTKTWYPLTNERNAYVHVQGLSNTQWNVSHGFNTENILYVVYDENNVVQQVSADIIDADTIQLNFTEAILGKCLVFCTAENFSQQLSTTLFEVGSIVIAGSAISVNGTDIVAIINSLGTAAFTDIGTTAGTAAAGDHTQAIGTVVGLQTALDLKEARVNKGVAGGYASLDAGGLIPVDQLPDTAKEIQVAATIIERDAIVPYSGLRVHVLDATADLTVLGTWAEYLYATTTWVKTSEADSIDVILDWAEIVDKPTSAVINIDAAVAQRHVHSNSVVLQGIEESFTTLQKLKLDTIATAATNYTHPVTHPAEMITVTEALQFTSLTEKAAWNAKLDALTYTGADILNKLLPVDGTLSGLDADKLDGHEGTFFSPATHLHDERYLQSDSKAVDSELLDGKDSLYFSIDGHTHLPSESIGLTEELAAKQDLLTTLSNVPVGTLTVAEGILATVASTQVIGTAAIPFKEAWIDELHLSMNTLYLGDTAVIGTDATTVNITADADQGITMRTRGTGASKVTSENGVEISNSGMNGTVNIQSTGVGGQVSLGATQAINFTSPETNVAGTLATVGHATFASATFTGDVTISGTSTTVNSTNVSTTDNIIVLNNGEVGIGVTSGSAGIQIDRGAEADMFFVYDEVADAFQYGTIVSKETVPALSYVESELATKVTVEAGKGLSTNDFTADLLAKVDAIEVGATNYVHPTYSGADLSAVQATLGNAEVISGMNLQLVSDTDGHVTGASSSITKRTLTPADIGALPSTSNAVSATKLATARTFDITGDVTGTAVSFDGSANVAFTAIVGNDTHTHDTRYYTETESNARFLAIAGKAADSSLLDSHDSTYFAAAATTYSMSEVDAKVAAVVDAAPAALDTLNELAAALGDDANFATTITTQIGAKLNSSAYTAGDVLAKLKTVDGVGSGLDADLFDGLGSESYAKAPGRVVTDCNSAAFRVSGMYGFNNAPANGTGESYGAMIVAANSDTGLQIAGGYTNDDLYFRGWSGSGATYDTWRKIVHAGNIASQSVAYATNAGAVDGINGASLLRSDATDYQTNTIYTRGYLVAETAYRDRGIYGTYDSVKTQHIWSMGIAYKNDAAGSGFGNLYGMAYKYNLNGVGHGVHFVQNGIARSSIGSSIWSSGNITAYSDARVKENLEVIPDAVSKVQKINGYTYNRSDIQQVTAEEKEIIYDHNKSGRYVGLIAQELLEVLPEAVTGGPSSEAGTEDDHYAIAYGNVVALLVEAIKEQQVTIDDQAQLINEQEQRLASLEAAMAELLAK